VELAQELIPGVTSVGLLVNVANVDTAPRQDVEAAGMALAVKIHPVEVGTPNDLDAAFQKFAGERVQAVIVLNDSMFFSAPTPDAGSSHAITLHLDDSRICRGWQRCQLRGQRGRQLSPRRSLRG
jgi:hypothetical protein